METLWASAPVRVGDMTLVTVDRAAIRSDIGDAGGWLSAFKEPCAIVVCDASGVRAFAMDSTAIALDDLVDEAPNLGAILSELSAS